MWLDGGWVRKIDSSEIKNYLLEEYEGSRYARNPQSQDIDMPLLVKNVRQKNPLLLVVDRAVKGPYQNYLTPEQHIPETGLPYPWETCMTMATSWSYVPKDIYKPVDTLIDKLVDVVSKGGNFLLNIGPSPEGEWDDTAYHRLEKIGAWLKVHGEAIYGTRMFDVFGEENGIRYTRSKDKKIIYVFYPTKELLNTVLNHVSYNQNYQIELLGHSEKVSFTNDHGYLRLNTTVNTSKFMYVVKIKIPD